MSENLDGSIMGLATDILALSRATGGFGWDRDPNEFVADPTDLGAKPIAKNEWLKALEVGIALTKSSPGLNRPVPGADPDGFVWLTWERGDNRFALALKKAGMEFERRDAFGVCKASLPSLRDAAEALRAAIPLGAS